MLDRIGQRERIPPQQVDVVEYQRRETGQVLRFYWEAIGSKLLQSCVDVDGVPEHNHVDDQPQRPELVLLSLPVPLS